MLTYIDGSKFDMVMLEDITEAADCYKRLALESGNVFYLNVANSIWDTILQSCWEPAENREDVLMTKIASF